MAQKWSLIKEGEIIETIINGDGKFSIVGGRKSGNHTDEWLLVCGWLPHIEPICLWCQNKGGEVINADHISYTVNDKTNEELDNILIWQTESLGNSKVAEIAAPPEKIDRMLARGVQLERKERKFGLTPEELIEADLLDSVNLACYNIRKAETAIIADIKSKTVAEKVNLSPTWIEDNAGWPQ